MKFEHQSTTMVLSIIALIISFASLLITYRIYTKQKNDLIIQSFFNDFALFLSYASTHDKNGNANHDAICLLIKLKLQAGFLSSRLFKEFQTILPIIDHLDLTPNNPNHKDDWINIQHFIISFTKHFKPTSKITSEYFFRYL